MNDLDPVELMRRTPHNFHPAARGEPWGLEQDLLRYLWEQLPAGATTLETGVGESTVVFLSRSARHIAVAPDDDERRAIVAFCETHGIGTAALEFHAGTSDRILPGLDIPPLDAVLIDGQHAFPAPFLDWWYVADRLKPGAIVLIDDVWIRTGKVLTQFLDAEPEWRLRLDTGRAAVFERVSADPVTGKWWRQQPWCHPDPPPPETAFARLRARARVRTRIRSLLA